MAAVAVENLDNSRSSSFRSSGMATISMPGIGKTINPHQPDPSTLKRAGLPSSTQPIQTPVHRPLPPNSQSSQRPIQRLSRTAPMPERSQRSHQQPSTPHSLSPKPNKQQQPIDYKQAIFMSAAEMSYVKSLASNHDPSNDEAAKHAYLRSRSQARYKNWGNTLEALREKKKADRLKRLEQIESAQQLIDQEEAHYQEAQRRVVIDRANRLLYLDSDRVKNLHSGLLLSSVLKEREAQIVLKQKRKQELKEMEHMYDEMMVQERTKLVERERREVEDMRKKSQVLAESQLEQLADARERSAIERLDELREGERLRKIAADAVMDAQIEEEKRQSRMKANNREYLRANQEQETIKQQRRIQEEYEEEKIAAFAAEKERLVQLRKEHEQAKFQAKQARFIKMIERQQEHLTKLREEENERVARQVAERKEREDSAHAAEIKRMNELTHSIHISRQAQIQRKQAEKEKNRELEERLIDEWRNKNKELEEEERSEAIRERQTNKRLAKELREQMLAREYRNLSEVAAEKMEAEAMADAIKREDQLFDKYCESQIRETMEKGKSPTPITLVLAKEKNIIFK